MTIQNLVPNPRLAVAGSTGASRVSRTNPSSGAPLDNGAYLSHLVNALGVFPRTTQPGVPWAVGETKMVSAYMRAAIGVQLAIGGQFTGDTGWVETLFAATGNWQRVNTLATAPGDATGTFVVWAGVADNTPIGTAFDLSNEMVTAGTSLWLYADGDSPGWVWDGTAGASVSEGPGSMGVPMNERDFWAQASGLTPVTNYPTAEHQYWAMKNILASTLTSFVDLQSAYLQAKTGADGGTGNLLRQFWLSLSGLSGAAAQQASLVDARQTALALGPAVP